MIIVRRPYRRTIGLRLQVNGEIKVSAPHGATLEQIGDFVAANESWITAHLRRYERVRAEHPRKVFAEGERFPYLGRELPLCYALGTKPQPHASIGEREIVVEIPPDRWASFDLSAPHPEMAGAVAAAYQRAGRDFLTRRLRLLSLRMDLYPTGVFFRSQKTRWGSCSASGRISLNWRLMIAPLEVIDYVIAHELSHLRHYDHGPRFWALVATEAPEYPRLRGWLRANQFQADFLAKRSELHPDRRGRQ